MAQSASWILVAGPAPTPPSPSTPRAPVGGIASSWNLNHSGVILNQALIVGSFVEHTFSSGLILQPPVQFGIVSRHSESISHSGFIIEPEIQMPTAVFSPPAVSNLYPADGATNVPVNATVSFTLVDYLYGIDPTSISIWVNTGSGYETVYTNGIFQPGFTGTVTPINPPQPYQIPNAYPKINFMIQSTTVYPRDRVVEWRLQADDPTIFPWSWGTALPAPRTQFRVAHGPIVTPATMVPTYNPSDVQVYVNTSQLLGTGDGHTTTFGVTLAGTTVAGTPGTIKILNAGYEVGTDNGTGVLVGNTISSGTINYTSGVLSVTFNVAPIAGHALTVTYNPPATQIPVESLNPYENTVVLSSPVPVGATVFADYSWFDHPILPFQLNNPDNLINERGTYGQTPCSFVLNGPVYDQPQQNQYSWQAWSRDQTYGLNSPLLFTLNQPTNKLFDPGTGMPVSGKAVLNYGQSVKSYDLINHSAIPTTLNEGTPIVPLSQTYSPVYSVSAEIPASTFQNSPNLWQSYDAFVADQDYLGLSTGENYGRRGLSFGEQVAPNVILANSPHAQGFYSDLTITTVTTGTSGYLTAACDNGIVAITIKDTTFIETYNFPPDGAIPFTFNAPAGNFQAVFNSAVLQAKNISQTETTYSDIETDTYGGAAETTVTGTEVVTTTTASSSLFIMNGFQISVAQSYGVLNSTGPFGPGVPYNLTNLPVVPRTFQLLQGGTVVAVDNGQGAIYGSSSPTGSITGTINYTTGAVSFSFATSPNLAYSASYTYNKYSEFNDFSLTGGVFNPAAGFYIYDAANFVYQITTVTSPVSL